MPKVDDRIAAIEKKMEQQWNRLRDLKAQATKQERKDDARRKLLYGAAYLASLETLSGDARGRSLKRVQAHITRPKDRAFLGLPIHDDTEQSRCEGKADGGGDTPDLPFEG